MNPMNAKECWKYIGSCTAKYIHAGKMLQFICRRLLISPIQIGVLVREKKNFVKRKNERAKEEEPIDGMLLLKYK